LSDAPDAGGPNESPAALREELRALGAAARALLEWHEATGAYGLPAEVGAAAALALIAPPKEGERSATRRTATFSPAAQPPADRARPAVAAPASAAPQPPPVAVPALPPAARPSPPAPVAAPAGPPPSAVSDDERCTRLVLLAEEVRSCTRCGLHERRKQTVFARGNPFAELCFVGEGPGADEDAQGQPFVGKAGQLLDKMIAAMGYQRDEVYICNIVKCRPPENRKPEPSEMAECMPYLTSQLALIKPKVIVALGATALQGLTGASGGIIRSRGTWKLYKGTIPVMPTFHPAYLLRTPDAKRDVWNDLKAVMKHLGRGAEEKA
jgi:uracil-DNA glycosylase